MARMNATRTVGQQRFETRHLTLQGENRLFELDHFLPRTALSEFCHLGFFLIIGSISPRLLQFRLQLLNGALIDLLGMASLNVRIGPLDESKQISATVDRRHRYPCFFRHRRNGDFVRLYPTSKHGLDRHSYLLVMLLGKLLARLNESVRMLVLWAVAVFGTHGPLLVQTSQQAGQWPPNVATKGGVCRPDRRGNGAAQEYLFPLIAGPARFCMNPVHDEDEIGRASRSF